jgi:aspartyl protease family protein
MSFKPFFWVIGAGLAIGVLWPAGNPPALQTAVVPNVNKAKTTVPEQSPLDIILDRRPDGHFYANVLVNGQQVNFLIDTGATAIALTADDARSLGFYWNDIELEPVGRGVSGEVKGKLVELHHVQLGGKEAWDMQAAIIPEGLGVSLLGQTFLSQIGSVKISGDQMTLR